MKTQELTFADSVVSLIQGGNMHSGAMLYATLVCGLTGSHIKWQLVHQLLALVLDSNQIVEFDNMVVVCRSELGR